MSNGEGFEKTFLKAWNESWSVIGGGLGGCLPFVIVIAVIALVIAMCSAGRLSGQDRSSAQEMAAPNVGSGHGAGAGEAVSQPNDVKAVMDRSDACQHLAGEFNGEAERDKQIENAAKELKCDRIAQDVDFMKSKYSDRQDVLSILARAAND
jgi:hypothetical protein